MVGGGVYVGTVDVAGAGAGVVLATGTMRGITGAVVTAPVVVAVFVAVVPEPAPVEGAFSHTDGAIASMVATSL